MSKTWRYIKDYTIVRLYDVTKFSAGGYEPVGGVAFTPDGDDYQAMALYDDTVERTQSNAK